LELKKLFFQERGKDRVSVIFDQLSIVMDFENAKSKFLELIEGVNDESRPAFMTWLRSEVVKNVEPLSLLEDKESSDCCPASENGCSNGSKTPETFEVADRLTDLRRIAERIRAELPVEAVMSSENICPPSVGEDVGLNSENTLTLDSFLYDEELEESLVQEGVISRSRCITCGSRDIEDLTIVTHSCSVTRLEHMFLSLLPDLSGKTVLDVGSRIGAVLWGAYHLSKAAKIIGVEINSELCKLQKQVVAEEKMNDRVCILEGDIQKFQTILAKADVVILNNVFDWFLPVQEQNQVWRFLHRSLQKDCLLVTMPALCDSLKPLNTNIIWHKWVTFLKKHTPSSDQVETSDIYLYKVSNPAENSPDKTQKQQNSLPTPFGRRQKKKPQNSGK